MNQDIIKLSKITEKPYRFIIGLMSGTSLDGLDVALCKFEGFGKETQVELLQFANVPYSKTDKQHLQSITRKDNVDLQTVCMMNPWIAHQHAGIVLELLKQWELKAENIDLIASHGQTVYHAPKSKHKNKNFPNSTLQLGDGDHLAVATGIITISDFRQKDIAAGNEGAPLAMYADAVLFSHKTENRVLLNIGGIANFTYLPTGSDGRPITRDTGPGNALMDAYIQSIDPEKNYDDNGQMAASGKINQTLLHSLLQDDFFKNNQLSTGTELFNLDYLQKNNKDENLKKEDVMATLAAFTARSIADAVTKDCAGATHLYVSGGGAYNQHLLNLLQEYLPNITINQTVVLGTNPDAKEAMLFALLANEMIGGSNSFGGLTMGKISLPH